MALLQEDNAFTHVIAIDFGTGASGYGIAPRVLEHDGKPRIEVFNPCDDSDDQKTVTAILFSDEHEFLDFGASAMKHYAEIIDDEGTALLFQNVLISFWMILVWGFGISTKCTCSKWTSLLGQSMGGQCL